MDFSFCPLSADWGSVADYVNGAVALGVGIAVYRLGTKTQETSDQVAAFEGAARTREEAGHRREGQGLLLFIYPDVVLAERALTDIRNRLSGPIFQAVYKGDQAFRTRIAASANEIQVDLLAEVIHRVHVLEDEPAGNALILLGGLRGLRFTTHAAALAQTGDLRLASYLHTIEETLDKLIAAAKLLQARGHGVMDDLGVA